jgi:hypothetical protein
MLIYHVLDSILYYRSCWLNNLFNYFEGFTNLPVYISWLATRVLTSLQ